MRSPIEDLTQVVDYLSTLPAPELAKLIGAVSERVNKDRMLRECLALYALAKAEPREDTARIPIILQLFFFARHPEFIDPGRFLIANFFRYAAPAYELSHRKDAGTLDDLYDHIVVDGCQDCRKRFDELKGPASRLAVRNSSPRWTKEMIGTETLAAR